MGQPLGNFITGNFEGPSKISFANIPGKEKSAWGIPLRTDTRYTSSDASFFSSSLHVLSHEKLNLDNSDQSGQLVDDGFSRIKKTYLEDEHKDPLAYIGPTPIGSFLPGDEDELLAGLMDDFDLNGMPCVDRRRLEGTSPSPPLKSQELIAVGIWEKSTEEGNDMVRGPEYIDRSDEEGKNSCNTE
ncbi:unnamed protein product [Fraxinus pennsylvanica]|uniref:Uncharacterized protein n=1 Tax=Fraxinus pennsylvanica TaxID=56036 RepID=A0AAD2ADU5_9LAMI|nr:unnamed protein product [Fraxinus pennsylvanica]